MRRRVLLAVDRANLAAIGLWLVVGLLSYSLDGARAQWCVGPVPTCSPDDPKDPNCYQPPQPDCRCEPPECDKCQKSPTFVGSGVYSISETDLQIPTPGFPLEVSRSYTSTNLVDGPLGYGWSTNLISRAHLAVYLLAAPNVVQSEAVVVMPDGARYRFERNGDGSFTPPLGRYDKLVANADGTFEMTLQRSRSVFHFNADGTIGWMADDFNNRLEYTYDGSGRLSRIADAAGSQRYLDVYWGADGRLSTVADHTGRTIGYVYDSDGNLIEVSDPLGRRTHYFYTPGKYHALLSQQRDNWDRVITTITYDAQDRVKSYTETDETWTYAYNYGSSAVKTAKSDSLGNTWIYTHDDGGLVTTVQNPDGSVRSTSYSPDGAIQQEVDELGVKTFFTYDAQGRTLTATSDYQGPLAVRYEYTYDSQYPNSVTSVSPKDPVTGERAPDFQAWRYEYYDSNATAPGALHSIRRVHADGVTTDTLATFTYDAKGRLTRKTDRAGAARDYSYDPLGNLDTVALPANNLEGTRPISVRSYDSLGRLTTVVDPMGGSTTLEYDSAGYVSSVATSPPDTGSLLTFVTTLEQENSLDTEGLLHYRVTDLNGIVTRQGKDAYGRLVKSIDALGAERRYVYSRDLLTSVIDENGNVTSFAYDGLKRMASTIFPDGATESYTYYANGALKTKTNRKGESIGFSYDRYGRIIKKSYPDSTSLDFVYSGQNLIQVADSSVTPAELHTFAYDPAYRLTQESQGTRGTIAYQYTTGDRVANYSVLDGESAAFTYYPSGRMRSIEWSAIPGEFIFSYDDRGQTERIAFPSGMHREYLHDDRGRLTEVSNLTPQGANIATYWYGYDFDYLTGSAGMLGQRTSATAFVPVQGQDNSLTKYHYTRNYQLTSAGYPLGPPFQGETGEWTYDAIGNRIASATDGVTSTFSYLKVPGNPENWDRLVANGSIVIQYDLNGNQVSRVSNEGMSAFAYDYDDRLVEIAGDIDASYLYDFQGRRTEKTVAGTTTRFLYRGRDLIAELGEHSTSYLFGPELDQPLAMVRNGEVSYFAVDGLGGVVATVDSVGEVRHSVVFDAWGNVRSELGTRTQPFSFTGREVGEAGTVFFRARYYQPTEGRFTQEDPIASLRLEWESTRRWYEQQPEDTQFLGPLLKIPALVGHPRPESTNSFLYAHGSPVRFGDPLGLTDSPYEPAEPTPDCNFSRYKHCCRERLIKRWCCKKIVDYACGGAKREACCQVEFSGCIGCLDEMAPDYDLRQARCQTYKNQCSHNNLKAQCPREGS